MESDLQALEAALDAVESELEEIDCDSLSLVEALELFVIMSDLQRTLAALRVKAEAVVAKSE